MDPWRVVEGPEVNSNNHVPPLARIKKLYWRIKLSQLLSFLLSPLPPICGGLRLKPLPFRS